VAKTNIRNVQNERGSTIEFQDIEDRGCNQTVAPNGGQREVNCYVPWATTEAGFRSHHMEIQEGNTVLFYIWQRTVAGDDRVRYSTNGWQDPGSPIPGNSTSGGANRSLRIDNTGLSLNDI